MGHGKGNNIIYGLGVGVPRYKPFHEACPAHTLDILVSVCLFDSLHPSQQFFSYSGMGLPWLNQY